MHSSRGSLGRAPARVRVRHSRCDVRHPCDRILRCYRAISLNFLCIVLVPLCLAACVNCTARTFMNCARNAGSDSLYSFLCCCASPALNIRTHFKLLITVDISCGK